MADPDLPPDLTPPDPRVPPGRRPADGPNEALWQFLRFVTVIVAIVTGAWFTLHAIPLVFFAILLVLSGGNVMGSNK
jgi:hypothetical protein